MGVDYLLLSTVASRKNLLEDQAGDFIMARGCGSGTDDQEEGFRGDRRSREAEQM